MITLQQAATELREAAARYDTYSEDRRKHEPERAEMWVALATGRRGVATLIDGMLKEHQVHHEPAKWIGPDLIDADTFCETGCAEWPCPSLRLVADLASATLGQEVVVTG